MSKFPLFTIFELKNQQKGGSLPVRGDMFIVYIMLTISRQCLNQTSVVHLFNSIVTTTDAAVSSLRTSLHKCTYCLY